MAAGVMLTVSIAEMLHPPVVVYTMVLVPAPTALTRPVPLTVATGVKLLLHVPPGTASLKLVVVPTHTVVVPSIAVGLAFTVTTLAATQLPRA
jgi:hypothetical protein